MQAASSFRNATANVLILLTPAVIGPIAVAEGFANAAKPAAIAIHAAALRTEVAAAVRALRQNLEAAPVVPPDAAVNDENVHLAVAEPRRRG